MARALTHAAAMRLARFSNANEVGDWFNPLHTFTYCNAVYGALRRCPTIELQRGLFHGAMSVYLDRFLNVPPAKLPRERETLDASHHSETELLQGFLDALDQKHDTESAARQVALYRAKRSAAFAAVRHVHASYSARRFGFSLLSNARSGNRTTQHLASGWRTHSHRTGALFGGALPHTARSFPHRAHCIKIATR